MFSMSRGRGATHRNPGGLVAVGPLEDELESLRQENALLRQELARREEFIDAMGVMFFSPPWRKRKLADSCS